LHDPAADREREHREGEECDEKVLLHGHKTGQKGLVFRGGGAV
jgi:hypothetical protein